MLPFHIAVDHPDIHHSMDVWHKAKKLKNVSLPRHISSSKQCIPIVGWKDAKHGKNAALDYQHSKSFLVQLPHV